MNYNFFLGCLGYKEQTLIFLDGYNA